MLFQSKLPISFWGDCPLTATYLLNRIPSRTLQNKSPCEVLYCKTPNYSHLRAFGCFAYANVPIPQRDKLKPRAPSCVFLGYPFAKKGYKLYDLASKRCFVSRDVVFHGTYFPFATSSDITSGSSTFSFPPPIVPFSDHQNSGHTFLSHLVHLFPLILNFFLLVPAMLLLLLLTPHLLYLFLLHPSILIFHILLFLPLHNLISTEDLEGNTPLLLIPKTMCVSYLLFLDLLPLLPVWNLNLFFILKLPQFQLGRMP